VFSIFNVEKDPKNVKRALVTLACATVAALSGSVAEAQTAEPAKFDILDNSFIVEEAFNQEPGIFQNIFGARFGEGGEWDLGFTQEWPFRSQTHQLSYTLPVMRVDGGTGVGDVLLNYRYQLWTEDGRRPAFSPRVSVVLPSGREEQGRGSGALGWQVNLPFSRQVRDVYFHWNGGFTWLPNVRPADEPVTAEADLLTPHLAFSAIWRTGSMFNVMLETLAEFEEQSGTLGRTERSTAFTLSPGFRTGWNVTDQQVIVGFAVPLTFADDATATAVFGYVSYELPFRR
jgi:hypothetical protein